ncbi:MAG: hypothetical protein MZW92_56000 [Comamonadaceae bacterium]|nr:hypothetical protein [Comamonadaceae bacterium]
MSDTRGRAPARQRRASSTARQTRSSCRELYGRADARRSGASSIRRASVAAPRRELQREHVDRLAAARAAAAVARRRPRLLRVQAQTLLTRLDAAAAGRAGATPRPGLTWPTARRACARR